MKRFRTFALALAVVVISVGLSYLRDKCFVEENIVAVTGCALAVLIVFLLAPPWLRLLIAGLAIALSIPLHSVSHIANVESGAVCTLRASSAIAHQYKAQHSSDGYPAAIPKIVPCCRARGGYEFFYHQDRIGQSGVGTGFTISAVPKADGNWWVMRSFLLTENGEIHWRQAASINDIRPASRQDPALF